MIPQQLYSYPPNFTTVIQMFETQAIRFKDNICLRYQVPNTLDFASLTYGQVDKMATSLAHELSTQLPPIEECRVIGYLLDDPVLSVLTILAILKLRRVFFAISPRNSEAAIVHLLSKTDTKYLMTSEKYRDISQKCAAQVPKCCGVKGLAPLNEMISLMFSYHLSNNSSANRYQHCGSQEITIGMDYQQEDEDAVVGILHSSGSTAFPKPTYETNRSVLWTTIHTLGENMYNSCSQHFGSKDVMLMPCPFFHGSGIYTFLVVVSFGAAAVLFHRLPPSPRDIIVVSQAYGVTAMTSMPIQLEEIADYLKETEHGCTDNDNSTMIIGIPSILKQIKFYMAVSAPLKIPTGDYLCSKGLNVRCAYGTTEFGIAMISSKTSLKENISWKYLRPVEKLAPFMMLEPISQSSPDTCQLILTGNCPSFASRVSNRPNGDYASGDLFMEEPLGSNNWRMVGRIDDTLVMKNGEKTNPIPMENRVSNVDIVRKCTVIGENRECTAILIELKMEQAIRYTPKEMLSKIYEGVKEANKVAPSHSTIMVPQMIYILPMNKKLPTTAKDNVIRKKAVQVFESEIDQMYNDFLFQGDVSMEENDVDKEEEYQQAVANNTNGHCGSPAMTKTKDISIDTFLRQAAAQVLHRQPAEIDLHVSLFDYGLNSLLAIQLRNKIASRFKPVPHNLLFEYPTIKSMIRVLDATITAAISVTHGNVTPPPTTPPSLSAMPILSPEDQTRIQIEKRYQETQSILYDYLGRTEYDFPTQAIFDHNHRQQEQHTVLLTGVTGSLGAFLLRDMILSPQIKRIYCLVRNKTNKNNDCQYSLMQRIEKSFKDRCIDTELLSTTDKVEALLMDNLDEPNLGLDQTTFIKLKNEVTMIQFCGWLVDFNQPVQHFERACIRGLYNILKFAWRKINPIPTHVVSSISATANYRAIKRQGFPKKDLVIIPECAVPQDPHIAMPMGYAQSKYIVEHLFAYLSEHKKFPCFVERLGQVCGDTQHGVWNTNEQYPLMITAGAAMKMMPDLGGDVNWISVDSAAKTILDIMLKTTIDFYPMNKTMAEIDNFFHVVNPKSFRWSDLLDIMKVCGMDFKVVKPDVWINELSKHEKNPAYRLLTFYENHWKHSLQGIPIWDTTNTVRVAPSLVDAPMLDAQLLKKCLLSWSNIGFYNYF
ncbi:hypothetical protein BDA99DRAFT_520376 [Phascolomyces articulosus]|uniref:Carrier domain-containing protein n=1 Tax=Phascolomyces articulosus TaxID=60185 RepID=A0AAD5JTH1_9FUNG|nr:hypothetical protein BDA99DRAFT_520376 [Phascolomyces articulosus]